MTLIAVLALIIGVATGLRTLTGAAVLAWAAFLSWFSLTGTWLGWYASLVTAIVLTVLALAEWAADLSPRCPSRTDPAGLIGRLVVGGFCGAVLGTAASAATALWLPIVVAVVGALLGTYGGHRARAGLASAFGRDWPAALLEDVVAIALSIAVAFVAGVVLAVA